MNSDESKSGEANRKKQRTSCRPHEPMEGCVWMKLVETINEKFEVEEEEWNYSSSILLYNLPLNLEIEDVRNEIQDLVSNVFQNNPPSTSSPPFTLRFFFIHF